MADDLVPKWVIALVAVTLGYVLSKAKIGKIRYSEKYKRMSKEQKKDE